MTLLLIADRTALHTDGWVFDDIAIFGLASYASPISTALDAWTPQLVTSMIETKAALYDVEEAWCLDADCWSRVAAVAAGCADLATMRPSFPAVDLCEATLAVACDLGRRLPCPPRSLRSRLDILPADAHSLTDLELAAASLARTLADDGWTDPDALAGLAREATLALAARRRSLWKHVSAAAVVPTELPGDPSRGGRGTRDSRSPVPRARVPARHPTSRRHDRPGPFVT